MAAPKDNKYAEGNDGGRPTEYTKQIASEICRRIATGESVRAISRDESMPCLTSVFNWLNKHNEFVNQYIRAKELQADYYAEEIIDIADDSTNDYMDKAGKGGETVEILNSEHISRSKLRVDTRKWLMGKLRVKKYGEKVQHTGDGGGSIKQDVTVTFVDSIESK